MDHKQTIAMLTWINQVDPRVMLNEAAVDVWAYSMRNIPADVAKQAVLMTPDPTTNHQAANKAASSVKEPT